MTNEKPMKIFAPYKYSGSIFQFNTKHQESAAECKSGNNHKVRIAILPLTKSELVEKTVPNPHTTVWTYGSLHDVPTSNPRRQPWCIDWRRESQPVSQTTHGSLLLLSHSHCRQSPLNLPDTNWGWSEGRKEGSRAMGEQRRADGRVCVCRLHGSSDGWHVPNQVGRLGPHAALQSFVGVHGNALHPSSSVWGQKGQTCANKYNTL